MLKITDFGIARVGTGQGDGGSSTGQASADNAGTTAGGTEEYMPPEQFDDPHSVDGRADLFSLGVCLFEMFCGRRPYPRAVGMKQDAPDPRWLRGDDALPPRLCELMRACVAWEAHERPADVAIVRETLCRVYQDLFKEPSTYAAVPPLSLEADGWNNRALSQLALGRVEEAERAWVNARRIDPLHAASTFNYGLHLWRSKGMTDETLVNTISWIVTGSEEPWIPRYLLAQVHLERGDVKAALQVIDEIREVPTESEKSVSIARMAAMRRNDESQELKYEETGAGFEADRIYACITADGSAVVSARGDGRIKVCDLVSRNVRTFLAPQDLRLCSFSVNVDGKLAALGSRRGQLTLWDVRKGRRVRTFEGHHTLSDVDAVCFSSDGKLLSSGSNDMTAKLWDARSGACIRTFEGHRAGVNSVSLSEDGQLALTGSADATVKLWDVSSGRCVRTLEPAGRSCWNQREGVALSEYAGQLTLWDVASGAPLRTFGGHKGVITSVCLTVDARLALSGSVDGTMRLWDATTGRCLRTFAHEGVVCSVSTTRDGARAVTGTDQGVVKVWDIAMERTPAAFRISPGISTRERLTTHVAYDQALGRARRSLHDGDMPSALSHLRTARTQRGYARSAETLELWAGLYIGLPRRALRAAWPTQRLRGHASAVSSVRFSASGQLLLSGGEDWTASLWDVPSNKFIQQFTGHKGSITSVFLGWDGRVALSGSKDATTKLWDTQTGDCIRTFEGHETDVTSVWLSSDERLALTGSNDTTARLWDVSTGRCLRTLKGHRAGVGSVYLTPDTRQALTGGNDEAIKLWDVPTGKCVCTLNGHPYVNFVGMIPDEDVVVSGSWESVKVWDMASQRCRLTFGQPAIGYVSSVFLTTDGRMALLGGQTAQLWDVRGGRCLYTLGAGRPGVGVSSVSLSTDLRHAVCGLTDGAIEVWFLDWELEERVPEDWDERARPFMKLFLRAYQPRLGAPPHDREPSGEETTGLLTRAGQPMFGEPDIQRLLYSLGCAGYGWIRPEGIREELQRMNADWQRWIVC